MTLALKNDYQQTWFFNELQVSKALTDSQVSKDLFYKTLEDHHIEVIHSDHAKNPISEKNNTQTWRKIEDFASRKIYEDEHTQAFLPLNRVVDEHIIVVLKEPKKTFSEVTSIDLQNLRRSVEKVVQVLYREFQIQDVVYIQYNRPEDGPIDSRFAIEIIPTAKGSEEVHNVKANIERNMHIFFGDEFFSPKILTTTEKVKKWQSLLKDVEPKESNKVIKKEKIEDWTQVVSHMESCHYDLIDLLFRALKHKGVNIDREIHYDPTFDDGLVENPKKGCAFCNVKVIDYQKVYESKLCYVLYNFKPSKPEGSFLILPKRHVKKTENLTNEEYDDIQQLARKLSKAIEEKTNRDDIKMYIQDGPCLGQTVPHMHMHFHLTPDPVYYMIFSINYDSYPTVNKENMKKVKEEVGLLLAS